MSSLYQINKGINRPIVFRGLKAQYISYLAAGLVALLLGFTGLYLSGLSLYVLLPLIIGLGMGLFLAVFRLSRRFGQHGMMKYLARRNVPLFLKFRSRRLFTLLRSFK